MSEIDMSGADRANYLGTIHKLEERRLEIDWQITTLIKAARGQGATWKDVGEALGVSSQAAWAKHHSQEPPKINTSQG